MNDRNYRQISFFHLAIVGSITFFSGLLLGIALYRFQTRKTSEPIESSSEDSQFDYQNETLRLQTEQDAENDEPGITNLSSTTRIENGKEEDAVFSSLLKNDTGEAVIKKALLSSPATKAEVLNALSFLPDVLAEVNGMKITKKQIVDLLLSKKVSQQILELTPESYLRNAMQQYVDQQIDTEILRQKAVAAGFVPSEELVKTLFDLSIKELSPEQLDAFMSQLKDRGLMLESYREKIAKYADIQEKAAIAAYKDKFFFEKAEVVVTDADVKTFYNENRQKYLIPENITVAHILIPCEPVSEQDSPEEKMKKINAERLAKEQIYNIYAELVKDPANFDRFAEEQSSSDKRDYGRLPPFDKNGKNLDGTGQREPDFTAAAFKLVKSGDISKPVHTLSGYHIIKLLKKDPQSYFAFDEVKQDILDFLLYKTATEEIQAVIEAERAKGGVKVFYPSYPSSISSVHATNLK